MKQHMARVFPQLANVRIEHAWGGFVDVTRNRAPDFGAIDSNYYYVQGFSFYLLIFSFAGDKLMDLIGL